MHKPGFSLKNGSFRIGRLLPVPEDFILFGILISRPLSEENMLEILIKARVCNLWAVPSANRRTSFCESCFKVKESSGNHSCNCFRTGSTSHVESYRGLLGLVFKDPLINFLTRSLAPMSSLAITASADLDEFSVP